MKRLLSGWLLLVLAATGVSAQEAEIKVNAVLSQDKLTQGQAFQLAVVVELAEPWHMNANPASLPEFIPTSVTLESNAAVTFGPIQYPPGTSQKVSWTDDPVSLYTGKIIIPVTGKVTAQAIGPVTLKGSLRYQACNDQVCRAPKTVPFSIDTEIVPASQPVQAIHPEIFGNSGGTQIEPPPPQKPAETVVPATNSSDLGETIARRGWLITLVLVFFGGMALNLTPCVYPMIAITVSYFGGQGQQRSTGAAFGRALVYFFGVTITYSTLGLVAALTGGLFGRLLQSPWVLAGIAVLLVALALSMFGLYELQPPQFIMQRASGLSGKAGFFGIFFLGATVGVIAAPCLAPILVALLAYVSQRGNPWLGWWLFFVLACGLGLPYVILGTFSGALARLPKSGSWMVWVKRVFGTILIGAAVWITLPLWPAHAQTWPAYSADAVAQATAAHKPVVIDFSASWCGPCREMERTTFRDNRVRAKVQDFVILEADVTADESPKVKALMTQFAIRGVPTLVFIDATGHERPELRRNSYVGADEFLELLDRTMKPAPPSTAAETNGAAANIPRELMQPF